MYQRRLGWGATATLLEREHLTFVKSLVKPHPNPLLSKEREQESYLSYGIFAKLRCSLPEIT
jgi:hypothetical protein